MATTNIITKPGDIVHITAEAATVPNVPPLVSAGADQTIKLPTNSVALKGTASDSDTIVSYQWAKVSGPAGGVFSTPLAAATNFTGLIAGTYMVKLTVKDGKGATAADDLLVVVKPADVIPPPIPPSSYLTLPISAAKLIDGQSSIIIENFRFENISGVALRLQGCTNIIIRNCFFNKAVEEAIDLYNCTNITVENCLFNYVASGVYALNCSNVKVRNCQAINPKKKSDGTRGQIVQFNSVGGTGNEIINNRSQSWDNEGNPEDHISLYNSSNVIVRGNMLRGGGPSDSGSGIMVGDNGGSNITVDGNTLLTTGNAGIGVAGGNNITVTNNKIYSEKTAVSNNPLYVWAQGNQVGNSSNATVKGNRSTWIHKEGWDNSGGWNSGNVPNTSWESPTPITLAEMAFPAHLITFVTPAELLTIRGK